jgi:hypothetical protein
MLEGIPRNAERYSAFRGKFMLFIRYNAEMETTNSGTISPPIETSVPQITGRRHVRLRHQSNPFLRDVVATLGDKRVAVSMKANLAEIDNDTGEYTRIPGQITKMISADRESFVKLYTAQIDAFFDLDRPGRVVLKYLIWMHQQEANHHLFLLHLDQARDAGFDIGKTTWYDGLSSLIDKKIVAASKIINMFFLNPAVFFNGDRTRLVIEVRKIRKHEDKIAGLEARGQERLLP